MAENEDMYHHCVECGIAPCDCSSPDPCLSCFYCVDASEADSDEDNEILPPREA